MNEKAFRTFCAIAIVVLMILIGWAVFHHMEHDYYDHDREGIHIESPWFEYKGDHRIERNPRL